MIIAVICLLFYIIADKKSYEEHTERTWFDQMRETAMRLYFASLFQETIICGSMYLLKIKKEFLNFAY